MEERDLHYAGVLQTRRRQVAQIGVTVEPASDARDDVRDADLVRAWFEREEVEDELVDLLDALGKSFSVAEIVWEHSARQWMPRRLIHRLPQWFDYDPETGIELRQRTDAGGWEPLAPWKFVVHQARVKSGLPIRGGLARIAAWAWLFKSLTWRDWVRFAEAYGQPIRIGRYHPTATRADKDTLTRAVRDVAADAAAILPDGMQIEFAVLGQTLTTAVRRAEQRRPDLEQAKALRGTRYALLKHPARLKPGEARRLERLRRANRARDRAYELKECLATILGQALPLSTPFEEIPSYVDRLEGAGMWMSSEVRRRILALADE